MIAGMWCLELPVSIRNAVRVSSSLSTKTSGQYFIVNYKISML